MRRFVKFWKIIVLDFLGVVLMVAALLTGWLPGPGGLPLFILGLSLLAVHHDWAKRYMHLLKKYADKLGDLVFVNNPRVQLLYDVLAPLMIVAGGFLLVRSSAVWAAPLGILALLIGFVFLLGNRGRWQRIRRSIRGN